MTRPGFGWVITPSARTPEGRQTLLADNQRFLETLQGRFETAWVEDHFQWESRAQLECWTALTHWAARFPAYSFGTLVLGQSYRNPALTAKMFATLHWLIGGRLIAGIGGGWKRDEYDAYGWPFPPARVRLEQLEEAVQIIRAMWTQSPANFEGKHYSIRNAYCEPRPDPAPPLLIAGGGEKLTLRVAAKYADWMNIPFEDPPTTRRKLDALAAHCERLGRDPATLKRTYFAFVTVSREGRLPDPRPGLHPIAGTPAAVTAQLRELMDMGIEHFMVRFTDFPRVEGAELFLEKVVPSLREA